ncbi:MAG: hypothetical protein ACO3C1_13435 [Ilumatobacteraceae bacterium]
MAFGQPSGPPASAKQVQHLLSLLHSAGHSDFRDARGPMGFNQRQAAGKFTRDEVEAFIEQLEAGANPTQANGAPADAAPPATRPTQRAARRTNDNVGGASTEPAGATSPQSTLSKTEQALRKVPSTMLAAELQRRGWVVMEP